MSLLRKSSYIASQYKKGKMTKDEYEKRSKAVLDQMCQQNLHYIEVKKAGGSLVNIAIGEENPTQWFQVERALKLQPSPAEVIIRDILYTYPVAHYREVAFKGLKFTEYGYARYDFLIQLPMNKIHILEYDGKAAHSNPINVAKDKMKTEFCYKHDIPLTRYNSKDYYNMESRIAALMKGYGIKRK